MLNIISAIDAARSIATHSAPQWLKSLSSATVIESRVQGCNAWCVVSVLVHGNEPSGILALYQLLKQGFKPAINTAFIVSSVRAASKPPLFSCRYLPGEYDLNRRFGHSDSNDCVTALAYDMATYIRERKPMWVLDIHNTSGQGPAFAVSVSDIAPVRQLAKHFTDRMIITHLVVGSLMEQNFNCPIVTIECGGVVDPVAHALALSGLRSLLSQPTLGLNNPTMTLFEHPVRVSALANVALHYGDAPVTPSGITLRTDIESLNQAPTPVGTCFGWINTPVSECLTAVNDHRQEMIEKLFERRENQLINRRPMQIFMATPRADIALSDCLFYAA